MTHLKQAIKNLKCHSFHIHIHISNPTPKMSPVRVEERMRECVQNEGLVIE